MYKKSILILQEKRFSQYVKVFLNNRKKEVDTSKPLLYDIEKIREDLLVNRNTCNIRTAFVQFIREYGFPLLLMLDYTADFGLPDSEDPDKRKLLRTILIAYIILVNVKGFDNALANIVLVINKKDAAVIESYIMHPSSLLRQFLTKDERVNEFINSFLIKDEKLKDFFNFSYIYQPGESNYAMEIQRLDKIIDEIDRRIEDRQRKIEAGQTGGTTTEMIITDFEPADVICRATINKVLVNGELRDIIEEEKSKYQEKNIILDGALTSKTIFTVKERITATFKAMSKINPFKKDERIFIHIPDSSLMDGSFASSMGTFLSHTLSSYRGISLNLGVENSRKLRNSKAYFAIKDFVIKNL